MHSAIIGKKTAPASRFATGAPAAAGNSKNAWARLAALVLAACAGLAAGAACAGTLGTFTSDANGFDTHTYYYDDGQEVTLIDTQFVPALTAAMLAQVKRQTASPVTRVIVTHANPDKFNGLPYLHQLGVDSITSAAVAADMPLVHAYKENFWVNVAEAFKPGTYPAFEQVKTTFAKSSTIRLKSGETLSLFELDNPGVAAHQVVVRIDATGDLLVGDLVHTKAHLWLEGGLVDGKPHADLRRWSDAVAELPPLAAGKPAAKLYGGRGEAIAVADAVREQQRYLARARALVAGYIDELGQRKRELRDPARSKAHYQALQGRFASAFPEYQLPYMIGYSVYGLVNTLAD
ncbi:MULTISPECIES: MBL fold metallo-hydrolase [unclassified Janthinobacterium]|uniref:MBL fold metallo-hydrolase n=1 Tax=unclassified Janthinobacterium TaxID=2610881 RepID=UPI0003497398|nr:MULTISPECIES: MBL fold metallo-hydrolase [unclassified Janthinobacterium]MEC5162399.1 glyoxylase-like metal-dependent hydrolase (beta-lactamase superfamily II) [Janthinobacterium sp. CG_S6]